MTGVFNTVGNTSPNGPHKVHQTLPHWQHNTHCHRRGERTGGAQRHCMAIWRFRLFLFQATWFRRYSGGQLEALGEALHLGKALHAADALVGVRVRVRVGVGVRVGGRGRVRVGVRVGVRVRG